MKKRNYFVVFGNSPVANNSNFDLDYWKKNKPIKDVTSDFASNKQASQGNSNEINIPKNTGISMNY